MEPLVGKELPVLTREQALLVADEIVAQAEAARIEGRNARARPVAWYYRCPELLRLAPWQRAEVVEQARGSVMSWWRHFVTTTVWFGACALIYFYLLPDGERRGEYFLLMGVVAVVGYQVAFAVWVPAIRREVRRLAAAATVAD